MVKKVVVNAKKTKVTYGLVLQVVFYYIHIELPWGDSFSDFTPPGKERERERHTVCGVFVCVCEREKQRERDRQTDRQTDREIEIA